MSSNHLALDSRRRWRGVPAWSRGLTDMWLALLLACIALPVLAFAFRSTPRFDWQTLGNPRGGAARQDLFLDNFYPSEADTTAGFPTKHWSREESGIVIPGLGRGLWQSLLVLNGQRPGGGASIVTLRDGRMTTTLPLTDRPRFYSLLTATSSGDWTLRLQTAGFVPKKLDPRSHDERPLGVILNQVGVAPVRLVSLPPTGALIWVVGTLLASYGAARASGMWRLAALGVALGILAAIAAGLMVERLGVGVYLPRLFGAAVSGLISVLLMRQFWRSLLRLGGLEADGWLERGLLMVFWLGFMVKAAGVVYPYTVTIDVAWHMQHTRQILQGHLAELYQPGAFSESVMPTAEWGYNRPLIPYSPFFHMFAAIFAVFPWQLETSVNILSALDDASRGLLLAALALKLRLSQRAAFLAALLYAITPFTFLLHSWGNIPTTFGLWWSLFATTLIILGQERLGQRMMIAGLTLVLVLTFLFYTVAGVFMGVMMVLLLLGLLVMRPIPRRSGVGLASAFGLAVLLALVIYYGQYIPPMMERTLPFLRQTVVQGQPNAGQSSFEPFGVYVRKALGRTLYYTSALPLWYGIALPIGLGLPGLALLRRNRFGLLVVGCWILVAALFFALGTRISMVDKQIFYVMPALTVAAGGTLDWAWQRWRWLGPVIAVCFVGTLGSALWLWGWRLTAVSL
ncbi:MAG: hypothetical protein NVSMB42_24820 [Herpetosiphon sp.]